MKPFWKSRKLRVAVGMLVAEILLVLLNEKLGLELDGAQFASLVVAIMGGGVGLMNSIAKEDAAIKSAEVMAGVGK